MNEFTTQRAQAPGRRQSDEECLMHEERLDEMDAHINKQNGWLKGTALIVVISTVILIPVTSWFLSGIVTKLGSIEGLLNASNNTLTLHTEQIKNIDRRVTVIEERHITDDTKVKR